ncbi:MAG: hypothetical protein WCX69_01905 [Candidatus Paceibacterota bacterium]
MVQTRAVQRLLKILVVLVLATGLCIAHETNNGHYSFCAGWDCPGIGHTHQEDYGEQEVDASTASKNSVSVTANAVGPGSTAIASADNSANVQQGITQQGITQPNPSMRVPVAPPQNFINQYGAVDTGADLLQRGMAETSVLVDAEIGARIVLWLQIIAARLGQGNFDSECPDDNGLYPLVSEAAFPRLLRDVGPMTAAQFVAKMKEMKFLAIGSAGNINMAVVSGPVSPVDGKVDYLRMIAFARNVDGSIGQILVDIPFSPETNAAAPLPPTIQPRAFAL